MSGGWSLLTVSRENSRIAMTSETNEYGVARSRLTWYFRAQILLPMTPVLAILAVPCLVPDRQMSVVGWTFFGFVSAATAIAAIWWVKARASALSYRLEGSTLRIDGGVFIRREKSIPLDRITDVEMVQGPLMRCFGLCVLNIQTAGSARQMPEGVLHGLVGPGQTRDAIMAARDRAARAVIDPA